MITFLPAQVTNGTLSVIDMPGTVATDFPVYDVELEDLDNNSFRVRLGDAFIVPGPMDQFATIGVDKIPLIRLEMKVDECNSNPLLAFQQFEMQGESFYYDENNFPFFSLAYEPVLAGDEEFVHPCGCDDEPKKNSWTPEEIVAGDNQVLTILGENFGVFQRGADPGDGGTGSSVLFYNGDAQGGNNPEYIAAGKEDFMIGGILKWTDTEIQVKVPSTDWRSGIHGPASTGRFKVRNGCNEEDIIGVFQSLEIPHALTNFRISDEGAAKRLGLRNNNGPTGGQDGYEFQFNANMNSAWNFNIPTAFNDALTTWCAETQIRFKRKEGTVFTQAVANDGVNVVVVGSLSTPNAEGALAQSQAYFPIDCEGSNPSDGDGGFIMADLDIIIHNGFAQSGSQSRGKRVLEHELGHRHNINHARCFGFLCSGPLMEASAASGMQGVDGAGGNRIFGDSEAVISNGCTGVSSGVPPVAIESGNCGELVASKEEQLPNLLIFPNPTTDNVIVTQGSQVFSWKVVNQVGSTLAYDEATLSDFEIDFSNYIPGTYLLVIENESGIGHFKIVRL